MITWEKITKRSAYHYSHPRLHGPGLSPPAKDDCAETKAWVQKRFHRARVKRVDGEEGRRKIELTTA